MPGRFTSNKQIIKSSPELFRGVQALSNSLVAKEQITAIQNQRDIDNFESLIDISSARLAFRAVYNFFAKIPPQ